MTPDDDPGWPRSLSVLGIQRGLVRRRHRVHRSSGRCTRTRFFLRIAFAETVALFGFVFVFIGAARWTYYAAAAVSLFPFWTSAAPTRAALARD